MVEGLGLRVTCTLKSGEVRPLCWFQMCCFLARFGNLWGGLGGFRVRWA